MRIQPKSLVAAACLAILSSGCSKPAEQAAVETPPPASPPEATAPAPVPEATAPMVAAATDPNQIGTAGISVGWQNNALVFASAGEGFCVNGSCQSGIALNTGADNYRVQKNWVCGNLSQGSGAGIGHLGFSDNGLIEDNTVVFNESASQGSAEHGGGIYVGGQPALVSPGSGTVTIDANLIRGNLAGAGDGGGIAIENVNGADILANPADLDAWDAIFGG